jgi:hypothetical protein
MFLTQGSATGALTLVSNGGNVSANGALSAGGPVSISGSTGINLPSLTSGGTTQLLAPNGFVVVNALTSPGAVTASGQAIGIVSPGALSFANAQATAGNILVTTQGDLAFAQGTASGRLILTSNAGSVSDTGPLSSGGSASITSQTAINLVSLAAGGTSTSLISNAGPVNVASLTSVGGVTARGNAVTISSPASLLFVDLLARAGAASVTTAGALTVLQGSATGDMTLRAGTALTISGPVTGANVTLAGTGSATVNGSVTAQNALGLTTGGLFTANALLRGRTIAATSGDLAIGATGRLGALGTTTSIVLTNGDATVDTRVGDGNSYGLSSAELNRLFADSSITVTAVGGTQPFFLDTITMDMTHLGANGALRLVALGQMTVDGAAQFNNTAAGQSVVLSAPTITVPIDTGSLAVLNGAGARAGTLLLTGNTITVASNAAIAAITGLPSLSAITRRLDAPDVQRADLVQAGTLNIAAANAIYVQNSGATLAYNDRRGFSADAVNITTGSAATRIAINGRIGNAVGLAVTPLITLNGSPAAAGGQFDPQSTVNGCLIGLKCQAFIPDPSIQLTEPVPQSSSEGLPSTLVTLSPNEVRGDQPLIDEPITGVGNDDLWEPVCQGAAQQQQGRCKQASERR